MLLRLLPSIQMDELVERFSIEADQIGHISSSYYIGYTIFMIPFGILVDKYSPRFMISICLLICSVSNLATIYSDSLYVYYFLRFVIGLTSVAGIIGSIRSIHDFYRAKYSIMIGMTIFIGIIGPLFAGTTLSSQIIDYGSDYIISFISYFGMVLSLLIFITYKPVKTDIKLSNKEFFSYILKIFCDKQMIILSILGGIMIGPLGGLADMWLVKYLVHTKNISSDVARFSMSLVFIGFGIGSPIVGILLKRVANYNNVVVSIGIFQIISLFFLFIKTELDDYTSYILCFAIGVFCAYQVAVLSIASKLVPREYASIASSILNFCFMLSASIYHFVIGYVLKNFFESKSKIFIIYDARAYHYAFAILILGLVIGVVGFKKVKFKEKIEPDQE